MELSHICPLVMHWISIQRTGQAEAEKSNCPSTLNSHSMNCLQLFRERQKEKIRDVESKCFCSHTLSPSLLHNCLLGSVLIQLSLHFLCQSLSLFSIAIEGTSSLVKKVSRLWTAFKHFHKLPSSNWENLKVEKYRKIIKTSQLEYHQMRIEIPT